LYNTSNHLSEDLDETIHMYKGVNKKTFQNQDDRYFTNVIQYRTYNGDYVLEVIRVL